MSTGNCTTHHNYTSYNNGYFALIVVIILIIIVFIWWYYGVYSAKYPAPSRPESDVNRLLSVYESFPKWLWFRNNSCEFDQWLTCQPYRFVVFESNGRVVYDSTGFSDYEGKRTLGCAESNSVHPSDCKERKGERYAVGDSVSGSERCAESNSTGFSDYNDRMNARCTISDNDSIIERCDISKDSRYVPPYVEPAHQLVNSVEYARAAVLTQGVVIRDVGVSKTVNIAELVKQGDRYRIVHMSEYVYSSRDPEF